VGKGKKHPPLLSFPISCIYLLAKIGGMAGMVLLAFNSDGKNGLRIMIISTHQPKVIAIMALLLIVQRS